jgi:hypothetical protein
VNPLLITLGLKALKFLLAAPKLRTSFSAVVAAEGRDVSPEVVNALSGNAEAIRLLDQQIDEALAFNRASVARLEQLARREGTGLDS